MTARREKRPRVLEVPRDREAEKALAGMAGLSLTEFRRICRGIDLQCLACGRVIHAPRRKLCDEQCRKVFMERLKRMGAA